jgi:hypothetical protein
MRGLLGPGGEVEIGQVKRVCIREGHESQGDASNREETKVHSPRDKLKLVFGE